MDQSQESVDESYEEIKERVPNKRQKIVEKPLVSQESKVLQLLARKSLF